MGIFTYTNILSYNIDTQATPTIIQFEQAWTFEYTSTVFLCHNAILMFSYLEIFLLQLMYYQEDYTMDEPIKLIMFGIA
jgi:hypothetical protein